MLILGEKPRQGGEGGGTKANISACLEGGELRRKTTKWAEEGHRIYHYRDEHFNSLRLRSSFNLFPIFF